MVMEEIKQHLGVHPRMPNWETHKFGTAQSLVHSRTPATCSSALCCIDSTIMGAWCSICDV